jgi:hypothetical protein
MADAPPLAGRRDDDEPEGCVARPPAESQGSADHLAIAFGHQAFAVTHRLFPVRGAMRPAHLFSQRMGGREVGRRHGAQRHAIGYWCMDSTH